MENETAPRKETGIEKHIQTILLSIITAFIITGVYKISSMSDQIIRMEERDKQKKEQIDAMQGTMNRLQLDMSDVKERITKLESKSTKHD
jgi:hypothetical protein